MTPGIAWDRLDDYTRLAVPLVLGRFPDWERYAVTTDAGCVRFTVPCPNRAARDEIGELLVWTDGEELTVGCGTHHSHFNPYTGEFAPEFVSAGLDWVVDVLTDSVGTVAYYARESLLISTSAELAVTEWPPTGSWLPTNYDRVALRTWSGDGDRDWPAG